jgi:two-component system LytT family response regulator
MRAIIVEDEPLARGRLRSLLTAHGDVEIVSEFASAESAREYLREDRPDLMFVDIELGDDSGLSIASIAQPATAPFVIVTTAFPEYALRAFDARALDYLMKPIEPARLREALDRVRRSLATHRGTAAVSDRRRERIAVQHGNRSVLIRAADIDWLESIGNYVKLHTSSVRYLVRRPLYKLHEELDPAEFVRIHRKYVVNVARIAEIDRGVKRGDFSVKLRDGTMLKMQATYAADLQRIVGRF